MGTASFQDIQKGDVGDSKRTPLTVHHHRDVPLHELVPAADAAFVQAAVGAPKGRDGQDVVEQNVGSMFDEPLVGGAGGVSLKVRKEKERNTQDVVP